MLYFLIKAVAKMLSIIICVLVCFTGVVVYEYELKIGWGKSVALPSQALPAPPPGQMAIRSKEVGYACLKNHEYSPRAFIFSLLGMILDE